MKTLLLFVGIATASSGSEPIAVQRKDLVGTWKDTACSRYEGAYEFRDDGSFFWSCADQIDGGKWLFHAPGKIELISYGEWGEKPAITKASWHHSIQIDGFARHRMVIRLIPGGAKDVLLKQ